MAPILYHNVEVLEQHMLCQPMASRYNGPPILTELGTFVVYSDAHMATLGNDVAREVFHRVQQSHQFVIDLKLDDQH